MKDNTNYSMNAVCFKIYIVLPKNQSFPKGLLICYRVPTKMICASYLSFCGQFDNKIIFHRSFSQNLLKKMSWTAINLKKLQASVKKGHDKTASFVHKNHLLSTNKCRNAKMTKWLILNHCI